MINVTITSKDLRRLEKTLTDRAAVRAYNVATFAANAMEEEVKDIIEYYFVTDRPANRRKGGMRLINSFEGVVEGTRGQLPVDAVLRAKRGADKAKILSLNNGSAAHWISPSEEGWLAWPRDVLEEGNLNDPPQRGQIRQAYGKPSTRGNRYFATRQPVFHPGNPTPYQFMEQARQRVRHMIRDR
jgi:hypothetical protein